MAYDDSEDSIRPSSSRLDETLNLSYSKPVRVVPWPGQPKQLPKAVRYPVFFFFKSKTALCYQVLEGSLHWVQLAEYYNAGSDGSVNADIITQHEAHEGYVIPQ